MCLATIITLSYLVFTWGFGLQSSVPPQNKNDTEMQIKNGNIEFKDVDFKYDSEMNKVYFNF